LIFKIKQQKDLDIIPNGIIHSLKYYLRFIDDFQVFIDCYTQSLISDAQKSTEIKDFHLSAWQEILRGLE
jgi:DNA (cytosine-5)-methyltransferase 1